MEIYADKKLVMGGDLTAFTNPAIEAGLTHCRALLEFLGLCVNDGRLGNVKKRRRTDIRIEKFRNDRGPLPMVKPSEALARYRGGSDEAEKAFLAVFHITNKGIAHFIEDFTEHFRAPNSRRDCKPWRSVSGCQLSLHAAQLAAARIQDRKEITS